MHVSNLVYPQWHPIPCNESLQVDVICIDKAEKNAANTNRSLTLSREICCKNNYILHKGHCYYFSTDKTLYSITVDEIKNETTFNNIVMEYISIMNEARVFFAFPSPNTILYFTYDVLIRQFIRSKDTAQNYQNYTFYVLKEIFLNHSFNENIANLKIFKCLSGEYISITAKYDNVIDCFNRSDESGLSCFVNGQIMTDSYCTISCLRPNCTCTDLYYQKFKGGCFPYRRKKYTGSIVQAFDAVVINDKTNVTEIKRIYQRKNISLFTDCTQEELQKIEGSVKYFVQNCKNKNEMPCTYGCVRCFPIHKMCVYELDQYGNIMHCPSGSHLKSCLNMECSNMFKCDKHYCVPYR